MAYQPYVEIEYLPETGALTTEPVTGQNNVSHPEKLSQNKGRSGFKGLYLNGGSYVDGKVQGTLLDGTFRLFPDEGYPGWNGNLLSGTVDTGSGFAFSTPQVIKIERGDGQYIRAITIKFDYQSNEYATEYTINGGSTRYKNRKPYIRMAWPVEGNSFTLEITRWSKGNSVVKVTAIKVGYVGAYDVKSLKTVDVAQDEVSSTSGPQFGIVGGYGNLSLINENDEFYDLEQEQLLQDRLPVSIVAQEIGTPEKEVLIAVRYTDEWEFDENTLEVKVSLKGRLERLKELLVGALPPASYTAFDLFKFAFDAIGWVEGTDYIYAETPSHTLGSGSSKRNTRAQVQRMQMGALWHDSVPAWDFIDEVAAAASCTVYEDRQGRVVIDKPYMTNGGL